MRRLTVFLIATVLMLAVVSQASAATPEQFKPIRIVDNILAFVDIEGDAFTAEEVREKALEAFAKNMRGMEVNDGAYVNNYPAAGYKLENVGYIIIKVMSMRTEAGLNVYHYHFEFGIPPRQVYWDTATMGVAPTSRALKKEVFEDVDEVMQAFAKEFFKLRGE
ncbi:hypothetical protein [Pseudodesulfovibrio sp. zrk46]|uniref:hypothetical protein n=1 Tax=Pseudodesulfovibrio sp. zrk46 TaxID=2725288 RepID=UPI00144959D4|nr:hypothetical protein [Pseudodesulfovibrio sp. zrk46]QJB54948.1 hypothetical protein HFN16_00370 [Pseudodesulfovibrio sp. zrk46]